MMNEPAATPAAARVHPTAIVEDGAVVGPDTAVWHRGHVREGARIGAGCSLGFAVYVDTGVVIGDRCRVQNHVSIYQGVTLEDDVFVGPQATFTNDRFPRASSPSWTIVPTRVGRGASIGANATVVCGVVIGAHAMVGAGAVVTTDVPAHALVLGTPARIHGWVCVCGHPLARRGQPIPDRCGHCGRPAVPAMGDDA
jgi:UDP-2-acetamido-3-amino-2,3-dideoxy-glucuronate N-acetyltransferase